jgi:hypothetical protein
MFSKTDPKSIEGVLALKKPTSEFLCGDAGYKFFTFLEFQVKNSEVGEVKCGYLQIFLARLSCEKTGWIPLFLGGGCARTARK